MKLFNSTDRWVNWWANRKIDWKASYMTPNHPHRALIVNTLKRLPFGCVIEVGCGAGANLVAILKAMPNKMVGGVDVNRDAIEEAKKYFQGGIFKVNKGDDIMLSDKSVDIILTDMFMLYISPSKVTKHLKEFARVAYNYVVFFELHSDDWKERLAVKWREGYNVYDYRKLLEKNGYYDISMFKMPKEFWPESDLQQKYAHIIVARVQK